MCDFHCEHTTVWCIWSLHFYKLLDLPFNAGKTVSHLVGKWVCFSHFSPFKRTSHFYSTSLWHPSVALSTDGERWQFGNFDSCRNCHIHLPIQSERSKNKKNKTYKNADSLTSRGAEREPGVTPVGGRSWEYSIHTFIHCVNPKRNLSSIGNIHAAIQRKLHSEHSMAPVLLVQCSYMVIAAVMCN